MARFGITPEALARLLYPGTMAFMGGLVALLLVISWFVRLRATYSYDLAATLRLQRFESGFFTKFAFAATWLGNATTVVAFATIFFLLSSLDQRVEAGFPAVASLLALPLNAILKNLFDRERPGEKEAKVHGGPRWGFSYPSGHSMASSAFYWTIAAMVWLLTPVPILAPITVAILSLLPLVTGLSRVYLGAHWLSDVVAGWAGGGVVALAASALYAPLS